MVVAAVSERDLGSLTIDADLMRGYLDAVGSPASLCLELGLAPPLSLSAWALGLMLDSLSLPPGAIHSRQEFQTRRAVTWGETLRATGRVGKPTRRAGMTMLAAGYVLTDAGGREVQSGRSTVLTGIAAGAADANPPPSRGTEPRAAQDGADADPDALPTVRMTITQPQLDAYALASGDNNPLHLDPDFAATTQFGGIVAHGMLTLAAVAGMMELRFGKEWLESGSMNVRFKGAAYVGDRLESFGRFSGPARRDGGSRIACAVGVRNVRSGRELITGAAALG